MHVKMPAASNVAVRAC